MFIRQENHLIRTQPYILLLHVAYNVKNKVESTNEYLGHY